MGLAETADTLALMAGIGVSLAAALWMAGVTWWDNVAVAGVGGPVIAGGIVVAGACPLVGLPMIVLGMLAVINVVPVLYRWSIWRTQRRGRHEWLASVEWAVVRMLAAGMVLAGLLAVVFGPRVVVVAAALLGQAAWRACGVVLAKLIRWGWVTVFAVCLSPRVTRRRRLALAVVGLLWLPFGTWSLAERRWGFPEGFGPPEGFRVAERVAAPESISVFQDRPALRGARFVSDDTRSPTSNVLDAIERRMVSAGWRVAWRQEREVVFASKGLTRAKFTVSDGHAQRAVTLSFYLDD